MELAAVAMVAGSAVNAFGTIMGGLEADAIGKNQQKQLNNVANTEQAISQRKAIQDRLEARLVESRAITGAAASGGGGTDTPGVADIISGINEEGEMNALTSLWEGDTRAAGLRYEGRVKRWEGKQAKKAAFISAGGNFLSSLGGAAAGMGGGGAAAGGSMAGASASAGTSLAGSSSFMGKYG